jgi:hypothetical protein
MSHPIVWFVCRRLSWGERTIFMEIANTAYIPMMVARYKMANIRDLLP